MNERYSHISFESVKMHNVCAQDGSSMLHAAANGGLSDLAKELIAAGVDIHHKDKVRMR